MWQRIVTFIGKNLPLVLAAVLTVIAIIAYNMSELLEKYHPKLVENLHYAIAAVILFGVFYLIVRVVLIYGQEDDDQ